MTTEAILNFSLTVVGFIILYFKGVVDIRERLVRMETKIEVFWRDVSYDSAKILHTPHLVNKDRDALLVRWEQGVITREEVHQLVGVLKKVVGEDQREFGERQAASLLLRSLEAEYDLTVKDGKIKK